MLIHGVNAYAAQEIKKMTYQSFVNGLYKGIYFFLFCVSKIFPA